MPAKKRGGSRKRSTKRELIAPKGNKRLTRRTRGGRFSKDQDDLGRSLSRDVRKRAKKRVRSGQGDKGDQKRRSKSTRKSSRRRK